MKEIKLTEEELKLLKDLGLGRGGKKLVSYLERVKREWFDPDTLTVESLPAVQEAWKIVDAILVQPLKGVRETKKGSTNEQYM